MEKIITKEGLVDILSDLAESFNEENRYDYEISLGHSVYSNLSISLFDRDQNLKLIGNVCYKIIDEPSSHHDVRRDIEAVIEDHESKPEEQ